MAKENPILDHMRQKGLIGKWRLVAWAAPVIDGQKTWLKPDGSKYQPAAAVFQKTANDGTCQDSTMTLTQVRSGSGFAPKAKERAIAVLSGQKTLDW